MNTVINTITIKPGESFTLPPGGQITYVSDLTQVSSNCEIDTVDAACYQFNMPVGTNPNQMYIDGLEYGGNYYSITKESGGKFETKALDSSNSNELEARVSDIPIIIKTSQLDLGVSHCQVGDRGSQGASALVIRLPRTTDPVFLRVFDGNTSGSNDNVTEVLCKGIIKEDCSCPYDN